MGRGGVWRLRKDGGSVVDCLCNGRDELEVVEEEVGYLGLEGRQSGGLAQSNCPRAAQCWGSRLGRG